MSIIPPALGRNLHFYLSGPLPCPYLPAQVERKLFTRLSGDDIDGNTHINAALCRAGFRRSHDVVYRPACNACNACVPARVAALDFKPSSSLRRILRRNRDLRWARGVTQPRDDYFALFTAYQNRRHSDSEMARMTIDDFAAMLQDGRADTRLFELREGAGHLLGCILADFVDDGFSAVYSFYAPDQPHRSLGTQLILNLIAEAERNVLPFVYLGYWVAASRKMAYKKRFQPLHILGPNGWDLWRERGED